MLRFFFFLHFIKFTPFLGTINKLKAPNLILKKNLLILVKYFKQNQILSNISWRESVNLEVYFLEGHFQIDTEEIVKLLRKNFILNL